MKRVMLPMLLPDYAEAAKNAAKTGQYYVEISALEQQVENLKKEFGLKVRHRAPWGRVTFLVQAFDLIAVQEENKAIWNYADLWNSFNDTIVLKQAEIDKHVCGICRCAE